MRRQSFVICIALLGLTGCAVGPNYKRPQIATPGTYRGAAQDQSSTASLADTKWENLFSDPEMNRIVSTALKQNFDLRIAAERIEQARQQVGITRANLFPFLDFGAGFNSVRNSSAGANVFVPRGTNLSASYTQAGAQLSWELDVWGRIRRLTESARAQYFATEEGRRAITVSLVSEVMATYFQLLELDLELNVSRKTRDIAENSLKLVRLRRDRGAASGLDVRQAEQLLYTATAQIAAVERSITQTENALSLLQGNAPDAQKRGGTLDQIKVPDRLPAGLPSALIERRPDIRQAEQNLIAANAQIGAAKALYFPQFSLTGFAGGQSRSLLDILTAPARMYNIAPSMLVPIFRAGQIRSQVRLTEAQQRELLVRYEQSIVTALREVSDALVEFERTREQRTEQGELVRALTETVQLSEARYKGGLDSYLQVLDAQRNLFAGELTLAQLQFRERGAVLQLYRALGGGWQ
jgi:NodT family efflux transporter outer membrane factor (OMF) lipoprotein